MKVAVIGALGMVGKKMLHILEEFNFPVDELIPVASDKSIGKSVLFQGIDYKVVSLEDAIIKRPTLALLSAGASISTYAANKFIDVGSTVIDNSSAFRMKEGIPLVIPEVNAEILTPNDRLIANPNCSTIQMLMVLAPIHRKYGIKRIIVSTYQSVTGSGIKAVNQMEGERNNIAVEKFYPYPIDKNCLPHCDDFLENDYTKEEMKLVNETHKILKSTKIGITATAVRVPVIGGHSESINIELEKSFTIADIKELIADSKGVTLCDDIKNKLYPMPVTAYEKDEVFVGRIRRDISHKQALNLWVVSDNIRKGAATNTIQIAEYLYKQKWL